MKELLIKIRALFEGRGISDARTAVNDLSETTDKTAAGGLTRLRDCIETAASKAGVFGGAVSALGSKLIDFAVGGIDMVIQGLVGMVRAIVDGIVSLANFSDQMSELGAKTGQSVETVTLLQQVFKNAGMGADAVAPAINKLQRALVGVNEDGEPTAEVFARLGLRIDELRKVDAATALQMIQEAIIGLKDPALQAQAAFDIFGRSSVNLMAVLKDPTAFEVAKKQIGELGAILGSTAEQAGAFADAIGPGLEIKKTGFMAGFLSGFTGDLKSATDLINNFPAAKIGLFFSEYIQRIRDFAQAIKQIALGMVGLGDAGTTHIGRIGEALKSVFKMSTIYQWFYGLEDVEAKLDQMRAKTQTTTEESVTSVTESAAQFMQRVSDESGRSALLAGQQASQSVATTGNQAAEAITLTADQLKAATQQITAAMSEANTTGVTPAMNALVQSVQESFARITGELTSALATMQSAQAEQVPAFTEAVAQLTATMAASTEATTAATATIAQSITTSAEKTVAATQQSAQAINQAFGQISQAIVQSNQAMANGLSSLASSVSSSLANLQQQINAVAARIR